MKFMMDGALTAGQGMARRSKWRKRRGRKTSTLGLTAQQVADNRGWYDPRWHYENERETRTPST